jgi:AraC-like DNA-binding protein
MTDSAPPRAERPPTPPAAGEPRATIGTLLDAALLERLGRATAHAARLRSLTDLDAVDICDVLVVDPRRLMSSASESTIVRRHVQAQIPCVYYTESSQQALRSVVAVTDVTPVRLVLFDIDDDPMTFREVIGLAPRHAHTNRLRHALKGWLQPLLPPVRMALDTVLRRPEQFFDATDVALRAGLSRRHLDRVLTAASFAPAKNWVVGARSWHAAFLIMCGNCSAESTASRLGYADSKALRRHLGVVWSVSPTQLQCSDLDTLLHEVVAFLRTSVPSDEGDTPPS